MPFLKPFLSALLIVALAVGVFIWLKATKPQMPTPPVQEKTWPVAAEAVRLDTVSPERVVYATVTVPKQRQVQAPFSAWVRAVSARPGDTLASGALIARLDEADARALLAQARADVADLEAQIRIEQLNLAAQKKLVARKLASVLSVDQLAAKLAQLRARLDKAPARLAQVERDAARAEIRAVRPLRVVAVNVAPGERVSAGQVLVSGYDPTELELAVVLPERVWRRVAARRGLMRLVEETGRQLAYRRVSSERTPLGVKLWFEAPSAMILGDLVKLTLRLPPETGVAMVPYSALYGEDHVYVVDGGRLRRVAVTWLGEVTRQGRTLALVRGLADGDQVLTTHLPQAIDGLKVAIAGASQP